MNLGDITSFRPATTSFVFHLSRVLKSQQKLPCTYEKKLVVVDDGDPWWCLFHTWNQNGSWCWGLSFVFFGGFLKCFVYIYFSTIKNKKWKPNSSFNLIYWKHYNFHKMYFILDHNSIGPNSFWWVPLKLGIQRWVLQYLEVLWRYFDFAHFICAVYCMVVKSTYFANQLCWLWLSSFTCS